AEIVIQRVRASLKLSRVAVDDVAARNVVTQRFLFARPLYIIDDEQVEQSIAIVIEPARRNRPGAAVNGGCLRDVSELATAIVVIQMAFVNPSDKQIHESVFIEVGRGRADGVAGTGETGLVSHVRKMPAAIIAEQAIRILRTGFFERGKLGAVREKQVETAVVVVVEGRDTTGHSFDQVLAVRWVVIENEVEPGGGACIRELHGGRLWSGCGGAD